MELGLPRAHNCGTNLPVVPMACESSIIELRGVSRIPPRNEEPFECAVQDLDLRVAPGSMLWLAGPAGGGKELLFRLLSLSEPAEAGEVKVGDTTCQTLSPQEVADLRTRRFGFVAAVPFLIPSFNAIENIAVPMLKISRSSVEEAQVRIAGLLTFAGLIGQEERPACELSPFEQARLALARALSNLPVAIFADNLEGVLPPDELSQMTALLRRACEEYGVAVIAIEGGTKRAAPDERRIKIIDGRIDRDSALLGSAIP